MSHRGPRKQQLPSVDGRTNNRGDSRRGSGQRGQRPVRQISVFEAYNILERGDEKIHKTFPLKKYSQDVRAAAFAAARRTDEANRDCEYGEIAEGASFPELRDAMLQIAYYNVRDWADLLEKQLQS